MSSVVISGNTSGAITLSAPDVAGTNTITLPASTGYLFVTPTAGTLATSAGGTGLTSFTSGGAMYATSTSALTTGTLPVASGGTGSTTAAAAFNALNPMTTVGDIVYEGAGPAAARLGIGSEGQFLSVVSGVPAWATVSTTPSTAQVQSAMAGSAVGALGTFGIFWFSGTANPGTTSSSISYSNAFGDTNGAPSGTWRCMSYSFGGGGSKQVTSWLRIS